MSLSISGLNTNTYFTGLTSSASSGSSSNNIFGSSGGDSSLLSSIDNYINNTITPRLNAEARSRGSLLGDNFLNMLDNPVPSLDSYRAGLSDTDLLSNIDDYINNTITPRLNSDARSRGSLLGDNFLNMLDNPVRSLDINSFIQNYS